MNSLARFKKETADDKASIPNDQFNIVKLDCTIDAFKCPEQLKSFEILFVKSGAGTLAVDMRKYTLAESTVYCLMPGQYRSLELMDNAVCYCLSLSPEFLQLSESLIARNAMEWMAPSQEETEELIVRMHTEYHRQRVMSVEILRSLLRVFIIYLYRGRLDQHAEGTWMRNDQLITQKFFELLQRNFATKKLVSDYATDLCITPNYLNSIVKKQTGFPASYHIQQYIVTEAKRQVMYSDLRMKEVAEKLGFGDYAHFSKFFKNYSGVSFSDFKRSIFA